MFKKRNKFTKESLLKLLVEQQTKIEQQDEKIKLLEEHIAIMDRLSKMEPIQTNVGESDE